MNIKHIQILSEAETDLEDGKFFYESQEQGVGEYFWDSLLSDIDSLIIYAGVHSKVCGYYRMSSKRFPYSIYYDLKDKIILLMARAERTVGILDEDKVAMLEIAKEKSIRAIDKYKNNKYILKTYCDVGIEIYKKTKESSNKSR